MYRFTHQLAKPKTIQYITKLRNSNGAARLLPTVLAIDPFVVLSDLLPVTKLCKKAQYYFSLKRYHKRTPREALTAVYLGYLEYQYSFGMTN